MRIHIRIKVRTVTSPQCFCMAALRSGEKMAVLTPAHVRQIKQSMPGSAGLPVIGHTLDMLNNPLESGLRMSDEMGPAYWVDAFGRTFVNLIGPDANQLVLRNQGDIF